MENVTVAEIAADAKRVAAAADAQCMEDDPLGLQQLKAVAEGSSSDETESSSSSEDDMDYAKDLLKNPAAALRSQRQQRKFMGLIGGPPAPPHSMATAARHAAHGETITIDEPMPPTST